MKQTMSSSWQEIVYNPSISGHLLLCQVLDPGSIRKLPPHVTEACRSEALKQQLKLFGRTEPSFRLTVSLLRDVVTRAENDKR
jgi:hypothetical protein